MTKTWVTLVKDDKPLFWIPLAKGEEVQVVINDEPAVSIFGDHSYAITVERPR